MTNTNRHENDALSGKTKELPAKKLADVAQPNAVERHRDSPTKDSPIAESPFAGPYRLVRKIGEGGFGIVYQAE